jgi:hypothetical protein
MPHDPRAALFDMIQAFERAEKLSSGLSDAEFMSNEPVQSGSSRWRFRNSRALPGYASFRDPPPRFCARIIEIP